MADKILERKISVTIALNPKATNKTFEGTDSNTVTLEGLRISATIQKAGGPSDCTMNMVIYGMTLSQMNQLSTLGMQINLIPQNSVTVSAGDEDSGMGTVFVGSILAAYADFNQSPEVPFYISAHTGLLQAVLPAEASSFQGSADVATIMSGLATKMGLTFENNGATGKLQNPYFSGSLRNQVHEVARAANISHVIDLQKLAIWPKNGSRGGQIPVLSKTTGMKGYPSYTAYGISVESVFNRNIAFGGKIKVETSVLPAANGEWAVYGLTHQLECLTPNGKWFTTILGYNPKYPTPLPNAR